MNNNNSNISTTSECSSGCESGWTSYWEQLSDSRYENFNRSYKEKGSAHFDHEEDDESMVSDASSRRRPSLIESDSGSPEKNTGNSTKKKNKKKVKKQQQFYFYQMDDTATSKVYRDMDYPRYQYRCDLNQYKAVDHAVPKRVGFFKAGSKKGVD